MRMLLEHIRYSDSRVKRIRVFPTDLNPKVFVVDLWYKGTAKGWKQAKGRAESIGLNIEEDYEPWIQAEEVIIEDPLKHCLSEVARIVELIEADVITGELGALDKLSELVVYIAGKVKADG